MSELSRSYCALPERVALAYVAGFQLARTSGMCWAELPWVKESGAGP
jgi:hypothetical protein